MAPAFAIIGASLAGGVAAGFHREWDRLVVRGSLDERNFMAFFLNQGRLDAVVGLNRGKDIRRAMPLIKARGIVDPDQLEDESVDLRTLLQTQVTGDQP